MSSEEDAAKKDKLYDVTLVLDGYQFYKEQNVQAPDRLNAMVKTITNTVLVIEGPLLESAEMTVVVKKQKSACEDALMSHSSNDTLDKQVISNSI